MNHDKEEKALREFKARFPDKKKTFWLKLLSVLCKEENGSYFEGGSEDY